MKNLHDHFSKWYRLTHWMSPPLLRRASGEYENEVVQCMYIAYRAGYNKANKERKENETT